MSFAPLFPIVKRGFVIKARAVNETTRVVHAEVKFAQHNPCEQDVLL